MSTGHVFDCACFACRPPGTRNAHYRQREARLRAGDLCQRCGTRKVEASQPRQADTAGAHWLFPRSTRLCSECKRAQHGDARRLAGLER